MSERYYYVTLLDRGRELTIEVAGRTKEQARRAARAIHPQGHIIHIQPRVIGPIYVPPGRFEADEVMRELGLDDPGPKDSE